MVRTTMEGSGNSRKCVQTDYAVIRPWGNITQTTTTTGPIDNNIGGFAYSASDTKKKQMALIPMKLAVQLVVVMETAFIC